jgi:hypothetical protein
MTLWVVTRRVSHNESGCRRKVYGKDNKVNTSEIRPSWAPRVPQHKIRQFYLNDANGIYDDELIDEVGYALLARCESFLIANDAAQGKVICPRCSTTILHTGKIDEVLSCKQCGWEMAWKEYFGTFQHKQLYGAEPVLELFRDFVKRFPSASKLQEKVLLIDALIHGYHWNQKYGYTRPVAINLIEGKLADVITFLDSLTYGAENTPGVQAINTEWVQKSEYVRSWAFPKKESDKPCTGSLIQPRSGSTPSPSSGCCASDAARRPERAPG